MSNELKCPICGNNLETALMNDKILGCPSCRNIGSEQVWQELIRTHKELEQSETCCTEWEKQALDYKAENIALSGDLECTRKALEIAVDALKSAKTRLELINNSKFANLNNVLQIQCQCEVLKINGALEQITALKQKDK